MRLASDAASLDKGIAWNRSGQQLWIVRHGQSAGKSARDSAEAARLPLIDIATRAHRCSVIPVRRAAVDRARAMVCAGAARLAAERHIVLALCAARSTARLMLEAAGITADAHILHRGPNACEKRNSEFSIG